MKKFKVGDVVQLMSGGPAMTVHRCFDNDRYECAWFDDENHLQKEDFKGEILKSAKAKTARTA